jgi:uncharacterized protein YjbI with pentapeptide repeats
MLLLLHACMPAGQCGVRPLSGTTCEMLLLVRACAQANAVSDKVLDLRMCDYSGKDLSGKTLSGALLEKAKLPNSNLREAVFSKASCPLSPHTLTSQHKLRKAGSSMAC